MIDKAEIDIMKSILDKFKLDDFNDVKSLTTKLNENVDYSNDIELNEALNLEIIPNGIKVGSWEIQTILNENNDSLKKYNIVNYNTKNTLITNIILYEAARCIVKYLNKGLNYNSAKIQEIVNLEENYYKNKQDAIRFKIRYKKYLKESNKISYDIFKSKYLTAKANYEIAQDHINSILNIIR